MQKVFTPLIRKYVEVRSVDEALALESRLLGQPVEIGHDIDRDLVVHNRLGYFGGNTENYIWFYIEDHGPLDKPLAEMNFMQRSRLGAFRMHKKDIVNLQILATETMYAVTGRR